MVMEPSELFPMFTASAQVKIKYVYAVAAERVDGFFKVRGKYSLPPRDTVGKAVIVLEGGAA